MSITVHNGTTHTQFILEEQRRAPRPNRELNTQHKNQLTPSKAKYKNRKKGAQLSLLGYLQ